jgi:lipoate-protein ligase A
MLILNLTLDSPAENLALDEALLLAAEQGDGEGEVLRVWEPRQTFAVLGSSSRWQWEVDADACRTDGVSIMRRPSGGAAIVTGPGCLMYALVLSLENRPQLRAIGEAHRHVLGRLAESIGRFAPGVRQAGTSDLALGDRKFSGNSMRVKQRHLLYHGTLLYRFPLSLAQRYLPRPPREPDYRRGRSHTDFLTNLPFDRAPLTAAVIGAFAAHDVLTDWPRALTSSLVAEKYSRDAWNRRI